MENKGQTKVIFVENGKFLDHYSSHNLKQLKL